jgi:putative tryptophan/tyrosine transport system substrate-binding protein
MAVLAATAAWPLAGNAQQPDGMRRVGVLIAFPESNPNAQAYVTAFAQALERLGWVEGKNIRIDYRFAAGDPTLFKTYAVELVGLAPDAILASTAPAVMALRQQTSTIPMVFVIVPDPVRLGLVHSLSRPGGNITGFSSWDAAIIGKWLQLLKEVAPGVTRVDAILNPETAFAPSLKHEIEAAPAFGILMKLAPVHDDAEIEDTVAAQASEPGGALACLPDPFNVTHLTSIIAAAARHRLPSVGFVEFAREGGLMSYWYDPPELHAQAASYIDRILRGASPADLPVQQPTKYSLIINLKTAKTLGLTVPPSMLQLADEVIE